MPPKIVALSLLAVTASALAACGPDPHNGPTDSEAVRQRAIDAETETARKRTGAEIQDKIANSIVRTVYLCQNGERLFVDFDNPRQMATVRTSAGPTVDLFRRKSDDGIWYLAGRNELRGRGETATWSDGEGAPVECQATN